MKRINVIGTTGSGKSTFAKNLSEQLNIPYVEMDLLFWKKDWVEKTNEEFFPLLEKTLKQESWVLDGNYNRTRNIKWKNVDTVIWIDYSFTRTLYQSIKRALMRIFTRKKLWKTTEKYYI